jgi:RNA polymerase sigma factor for flagellar operon FliA
MHRAIANYATTGVDSDEELLRKYGSLIDRSARRIVMRTGLHSAYDDMWSAGALGLIEAARRFDGARGASFETFAEHRVRGAMLDELRRMDHLPRRLRNRTDDLQKSKRKLSAELGRDATIEEVAADLKVEVEEASGIESLLEPHLPSTAPSTFSSPTRARIPWSAPTLCAPSPPPWKGSPSVSRSCSTSTTSRASPTGRSPRSSR